MCSLYVCSFLIMIEYPCCRFPVPSRVPNSSTQCLLLRIVNMFVVKINYPQFPKGKSMVFSQTGVGVSKDEEEKTMKMVLPVPKWRRKNTFQLKNVPKTYIPYFKLELKQKLSDNGHCYSEFQTMGGSHQAKNSTFNSNFVNSKVIFRPSWVQPF